ncbi:hypothetical protein [Winogradskyella sp. PE311]|uniref:hypothetical protein n=1 Tax=Winogradskyella sp. PE311 TaxID=3366943 RepID=UPI00397FFB13
MKTRVTAVLILLLITSCVPYKIAPKFKKEGYKVVKAKKFKRKLPNETSFIFKDPKDADEFYNYIDTKYQLNGLNVDSQVEFNLDGNNYYLSYSETEIEDKALNLPLIVVDAKREQNGNDPLFSKSHVLREGHWYLILTVYDDNIKNCLSENYPNKPKIIQYLKKLKQEYITTHNYEELLFEKKS